MTEQLSRPDPASGGTRPFNPGSDLPEYLVELSGELDMETRADAIRACLPVGHARVRVDLSKVVFLDCAGYDAFVTAAAELDRRGGSLALTNAAGQPRRLLVLLDRTERGLCVRLRDNLASECRAPHESAAAGGRLAP